jgi:hypothetical protein
VSDVTGVAQHARAPQSRLPLRHLCVAAVVARPLPLPVPLRGWFEAGGGAGGGRSESSQDLGSQDGLGQVTAQWRFFRGTA